MTAAPPPLAIGIGTWRGGGGAGLHTLRRAGDGLVQVGAPYPAAANAAFSVYAPRRGLHYIVDEADPGSIGVYRYRDPYWERCATIPVAGAAPCHIALDRSETLLATANYASGSITLVRLDPQTGLPTGAVQTYVNRGAGPNLARQATPHAHWVGFSPDAHWLYQTDLGTDEILAFPLAANGTLDAPRRGYRAVAGSGPRHLLLHPTLEHRAYLVGELDNSLSVLDRRDASFTLCRRLPTLPAGWRGDSIVAHIAINRAGDRLYVSNRGHDSIAIFALDAAGFPTLLQHVASGGASPRFFLLVEDAGLMVVVHERAQTVTTLTLDATGRLAPTGVVLAIPGAAYAMRLAPVEPPAPR